MKSRRQTAILDLVDRSAWGARARSGRGSPARGIEATQSTISRDIEELGLARVHDPEGMRYVVPGGANGRAPVGPLKRLLDEFALSLRRTDAGLLVRTPPGAAAALAEGLDRAGLAEVAGTIAGDDTILILGNEGVRAADLESALTDITEGRNR